ncbi:MAG: tRNA (N(6)-L-threonylcarbamoyladenosine(37)-C(2))-methylthiotransferase MtaB, partial [Roseomonas sp.]|nr:tRNA (N(6)-L-threonylcarbamoyladenosine(37)-C(2))-methylthiotransferase MtaB [Roseomonas sp.]
MTPELLTFGCRLNASESAAMRELAAQAGQGDVLIVNTCAVTAEAEAQARQAIRKAARDKPGQRIIVTGCAAQIAPGTWASLPGVARVIGNADKLNPATWAALDTPAPVSDIMTVSGPPARMVTEFSGRARAFVQVQQGCDHRCT